MLTQETVKALAEKTGTTQKVAREHLDAFKEVVVESLQSGEGVDLKGFVTFSTKEVAERTAKNPKTKEDVVVPAHRKATASLAKSLRKI